MKRIVRVLFISFLMMQGLDAKKHYICQKNIPFVITESGKYILVENVTYNGSGNVITIRANNVKLDLCTSSITLSNNNATAISVENVSEFEIESDAIQNTSLAAQNGYGIHISGSTKGFIKNIFTISNLDGLFIENSSDIIIKYSRFSNALNAGAYVTDSMNIKFKKCIFINNGNGLKFSGNNGGCSVLNCDFPSSTFSNLLVQQMTGMRVENCSFTNTIGDPTKLNLVQFGDAAPGQACNDIVFSGCKIINRPSHTPLGNTAPEGLGFYQGSGFVIDSCIIDIDNTNQDPTLDLSAIHVSNPGLGVSGTVASNAIIKNCIIQGFPTNGIYPDTGSTGIAIKYSLVTGALKNGIFLAGTTSSVVKKNTIINNATNGIFLGETSIANAIYDNVVSGNGFNAIVTSLLPMGDGIAIASDSKNNILKFNQVFNNTINGIDDQGTGNQIYNNNAYANTNQNYNAATDIIIISHPGDPSKAAENIAP